MQKQQGGRLAETLIELGHLSPEVFAHFLARQPGIASIDLEGYEVSDEVAALIPGSFARQHEVFPLDRLGGFLTVAMVCPLDRAAIEEMERMTGLRVQPVLCGHRQLAERVEDVYGPAAAQAGGDAFEASGAGPMEELGEWFQGQLSAHEGLAGAAEPTAFVEFPAGDALPEAASGYVSWPGA